MLRRKFTEIELGKKNEPIIYESQDEIGSLVKEYNRMVAELKKNIDLMAQNEREAAWKEMAKSVAHEIKNPLTPMRLNMQQLQRLWNNEDKRFGDKFKDMSVNFIAQIDILTHIATSFSSYAKMPPPNNGVFNVVQVVKNAVSLFQNNEEGVELICYTDTVSDEILVFADMEQFTRVVVNLVKNSIQAMPPNKEDGCVKVLMKQSGDKIIIAIEDNGSGITEEAQNKIFTPSFTTKSSGSGLGLAMSKEIIIAAKGNISFETSIGEGTTFFIELPIHIE